ncbi:MAG: CoA-binding protein [Dehalococcoidia bacterium]
MSGSHPHSLDFLFHPRSVAVVGVSGKQRDWGGGEMFVRALQFMQFPGPIYPVNPRAQEVMGLPCYPSVREIPGPVDYVISSIPATAVLQLMDDAAAKGVRAIHFFTAGFRETGKAELVELERQVLERARSAGIRLIGPNCMGLYCPAGHLSFNRDSPTEPGNVAFISQSGLNAEELVLYAALRGVRFSKVISYGNATDLDESDLFEYCTVDPETEIIVSYIEGVKDGPRFLRAVRAASAAKPTILLKGGLTRSGSRAADSHTGSLAGSAQVWDALSRQAGALSVETLQEMEDLLVTFRFLPRPEGRGVAIIGVGGGSSVLAADMAERLGLEVPALSDDLQAELRQFTPVAGTSVRNPLDTVGIRARDHFLKTVRLVGSSPDIHVLLIQSRIDWNPNPGQDSSQFVRQSVDILKDSVEAAGKPIAVVIWPPISLEIMGRILDFQRGCAEAGLPVYWGVERALCAISRVLDWYKQRAESGL